MRHLRLLALGAGTLVLAALLVAPTHVMAAVTASGSFSITSFNLGDLSYTGFIDLDTGTPLGDAIVAGDGHDLDISGMLSNASGGPPPHADFNVTAEDTEFSFDAEGSGTCTTAFCVNGPVTLAGQFTSLDDLTPPVLPANSVHVFDGTIGLNLFGTGVGGQFCLNSFPLQPTGVGLSQMVSSNDTFCDSANDGATKGFDASIIFDEITAPGDTTFAGISDLPAGLPQTITLNELFSVFIDISTTATITGGATVCVKYADADGDGIVDGTNGSEEVLTLLHGEQVTFTELTTITVDTDANEVCGHTESLSPFVLAAGPPLATTTTTSTSSTTVVTTSTTTTTAPELLTGKKLLLKENTSNPSKRKLTMLSKDAAVTLGDGPGSADDPTTNGGSVRLMSTVSAGGAFLFDVTYDLPASSWKLLGKEDNPKGYKFKGSSAIKMVMIKGGKLLKIVGKGTDTGFGTTDPNPVNVELTLGAQTYCLTYGGQTTFKEDKKYLAKDASAGTCPGSPSGAFLN
jgi:hypothetical protein